MAALGAKKTIIYSLLPLIVLLVALEGTFRIVEVWLPPWEVDYGWGFTPDSRIFIPDPETPGQMITAPAKLANFVFNEESFAAQKPEGTFRVFAVGGSSVMYALDSFRHLGRELSLDALGQLTFEFIDAGGCGYGSHRLVPIVTEVLNYDPDLILLYTAHNEFQENEQLEFAHLQTLPLQKVLDKSAFCRFLRDRIASFRLGRLRRERNAQILQLDPQQNGSLEEKRFNQKQIDERMAIYEQNLNLIIDRCKARNVPLVLSTVPSNLWNPRLDDKHALKEIRALYDAERYEEGKQRAQEALRQYTRYQSCEVENSIVRRLARENGIPLADIEARVVAGEPHHVPGETMFRDWCHMNDQGVRLMMDAYREQIETLLDKND